MAAFLVNGPPPAPLMAVAATFYNEGGVGEEDDGVGTGLGDDEMDQDHFNELDKIFDLPYPGDGPDPFAAPGSEAGGGGGGNGGGGGGGPVATTAAAMMMQPPYLQHHGHGHGHGGPHGMDWHSKEEDASYHTAVDASCHTAVDASYHPVDASTHSYAMSMVDASTHSHYSHSVMDASGHESLTDYSQHGHDFDYSGHGGGAANGGGGKGEPRFMEHSCEACKRSKKRCNRRNPCQICTARGIKCVPQVRGPGRPPGSKSSRSSSSSLGSGGSSSRRNGGSDGRHGSGGASAANNSSHGPSPLSRTGSSNSLVHHPQALMPHQEGGAGASATGAARGGRPPPPRDPWHCRFFFEAARHCKEAFLKAWHENELDTARCILLRNLWSRVGARFPSGVDVTFGICEQVQEAVGPPPPPDAPPATSPATRSKSHAAQMAREMTHPGAKDGLAPWCFPEDLRRLDDGCSLLCGFMHAEEETLVYTDEKFAATFMGREEIARKVESFAVLPILLLAEIFHPDDLPDVYAAIGAYWFRKSRPLGPDNDRPVDAAACAAGQEASWLCKCVDKCNNEFLALARFRSFAAPGEGYPGAALLAIRPLQQSKYLCDGDALASLRQPPARLLRDTLGALPLSTAHEYEETDSMFPPLRRGATVLAAEASGPKPVPGQLPPLQQQQQHHHQEPQAPYQQQQQQQQSVHQQSQQPQPQPQGASMHGGAPHQVGMSWSGLGITERPGPGGGQQHQHQHQSQAAAPSAFQASGGLDTSGSGSGGCMATPAVMTSAPAALAVYMPAQQQPPPHHQQQHQQHQVMTSGKPQLQVRQSSVSSVGTAASSVTHGAEAALLGGGEEEDNGSTATDFDAYGSSPSPEPALLSHSRSSPALSRNHSSNALMPPPASTAAGAAHHGLPPPAQQQQQQQQQQKQQQQKEAQPQQPVPVPGASAARLSAEEDPTNASGRGSVMSHSSSVTDLDVSCHGPQDPNGYGGLQWTPAPLNHLIGAIGGLVGAVKGAGSGSSNSSGQEQQQQHQQQQRRPQASFEDMARSM